MSFGLIAFYSNYVSALANWDCIKSSPKPYEKIVTLTSTFGNAPIQ